MASFLHIGKMLANRAMVDPNTGRPTAEHVRRENDRITNDQNISRIVKLTGSYILPSNILTASGTVITIAAHTRYYMDGTTVAVSSGTLNVTAGTLYYVYYNDAGHAGGSVTYIATVNIGEAAQITGRHFIGSITTPASGGSPTNGRVALPVGVVV